MFLWLLSNILSLKTGVIKLIRQICLDNKAIFLESLIFLYLNVELPDRTSAIKNKIRIILLSMTFLTVLRILCVAQYKNF